MRKNSTVASLACGLSPIKIHYSDYPKRINEVYVFSIKYCYSDILLKTPELMYSNVYCDIVVTVSFSAITLVIVSAWFP